MERAVVRMYFEDQSFKTFLLVPTTTAGELCEQVRTKLKTNCAYYLYAYPPQQPTKFVGENEKPWALYKQYAEKCKFVFRTQPEPGVPRGDSTPTPPARTQPPVPQRSPASLPQAAPQQATPQPAPAAGGAVTADDFDALLNQLQFDVGGGAGGGAAAGGASGASMFGDPFGAFDLTASAKPLCSACGQPILRNQLTAFGMQWHKEHLACEICKRTFLDNDVPVVEGNDGKAYCQTDYLNKFAPKCARCTKPIAGECTNALGKQWHPACFVCKTCSQPFSGTFFEHEGHAYCEKHYYDEKGLICPECERPIIGKCITAKGKRYHPQHFLCSHCKKKLGGNEYFYHDSKLFCKTCSVTFYG